MSAEAAGDATPRTASGASTSSPCVRKHRGVRSLCGDHRVEQRRLADPRLAADDHAAGRAVAGAVDERSQERPLGVPADQHGTNVQPPRRVRSRGPDQSRHFGRGDAARVAAG